MLTMNLIYLAVLLSIEVIIIITIIIIMKTYKIHRSAHGAKIQTIASN